MDADADDLAAVALRAGLATAALAERDAAIRASRSQGRSLRQIAEAAGLSHGTVATITRTNPKES